MKLFNYDQFSKTIKREIISLTCKKYDIKNYTINDDGTVDVDGDVILYDKGLTKIPLRFGKVTGDFALNNNRLTSLKGSPKEVGGSFDVSYNQLVSLEGGPKKVGYQLGLPFQGYFSCHSNKLTSLEGCPSEVGGNFWCYDNQLKDVKGFPRFIKGEIAIRFNPFYEIFKLFPDDRWKEAIEYLNEYDVIRDGKKVVLQALEVVYDELGLEVPENIEIKGYEII